MASGASWQALRHDLMAMPMWELLNVRCTDGSQADLLRSALTRGSAGDVLRNTSLVELPETGRVM